MGWIYEYPDGSRTLLDLAIPGLGYRTEDVPDLEQGSYAESTLDGSVGLVAERRDQITYRLSYKNGPDTISSAFFLKKTEKTELSDRAGATGMDVARWPFQTEMQLMVDDYPVYPFPIGMNMISDQLVYCWFSYFTNIFWAPIGTLQVRGDTEDEEALDYDQAFAEPTQDGKKIFEMSTAGIGVVTVGLMVAILSFD